MYDRIIFYLVSFTILEILNLREADIEAGMLDKQKATTNQLMDSHDTGAIECLPQHIF